MKRKASNHRAFLAPFPYIGSKASAARHVWDMLGDVDVYVEPFAGSAAVLLWRPHEPRVEVLNDKDCFVANAWRAIQYAPDYLATVLARPVSEPDIFAFQETLLKQKARLANTIKADPGAHDVHMAAMWIAGANATVGRLWCSPKEKPRVNLGRKGFNLQDKSDAEIADYLVRLSHRLRHVTTFCGTWKRAVSKMSLYAPPGKTVGIFLDPPYLPGRKKTLYAEDDLKVAHEVAAWARAHEHKYRIVLAGYTDHYDLPGWTVRQNWKRFEGFSALDKDGDTRDSTKHREALFSSPACMRGVQWTL